MNPICIDLYCGLGGWSEGFLAEGYNCIGFDLEAHDYGTGGYPGELRLRDVRSIHGSEFKDATCIVGSSPCQEFSYRAMPWKRAKALPPPYLGMELFNAQFRIQREACEAAGRYIPMVCENVRGAQKWVGRAKANFGSFYLWGDVGMVGNRVVPIVEGKLLGGRGVCALKGAKVPGFRFDGESHGSFQSAAVAKMEGAKTPIGNCSEVMWKNRPIARYAHPTPEEMELNGFTDARKNDGSGWTEKGSLRSHNRLVPNTGVKVSGINLSEVGFNVAAAQRYREGIKQAGIGGVRENGKGDAWFQDSAARHGNKSDSRKAASAMIAKIPFPLANHIAKAFLPVTL